MRLVGLRRTGETIRLVVLRASFVTVKAHGAVPRVVVGFGRVGTVHWKRGVINAEAVAAAIMTPLAH